MIGSSGLYSARKQNDALEFLLAVSGYLERGSERGFVADTTLATQEKVISEVVINAGGGASKRRTEKHIGINVGPNSSVIETLNGSADTVDDYCFDDGHRAEAQMERTYTDLPKYPMIRVHQFGINGKRLQRTVLEHMRKVPEAIPYGFRRVGDVWIACNKDGKIDEMDPGGQPFYLLRMALIHRGTIKSGHYWMVYLAKDHSRGIVANDCYSSCLEISLDGARRDIRSGACALFYELQDLEPVARSGR
jgi:hypothetical protein